MVVQVRAGKSMRSVAREHQISLSTVQWWMRRAADLPLERVDWKTHPPIATKIRRTDATIEDVVVSLRRELKETSDLGEYGARAIHRELVVRAHEAAPPSVRTVGRILERRVALDDGFAECLLPLDGICRMSHNDGPSSTASTSSRDSPWRAECAWRPSTSSLCTAGCRAPGRRRW